ncbi:MAG: tetratricopeptide repeat protein [Bryobacterales bacterium]|nr:tetratricopeptide repeat protein [Bryobacterales bacterium]
MRILRLAAIAVLALPTLTLAANKEHEAIQRDIALLQDQLRAMQKSLDERMAALMAVVQQSVNSADKSNTSILVLETKMTERMQTLERSLTQSLATMGTKVDTMADEFRILKENMADLNSKMSRLQTKFVDVENAVKTLQAPPPPPPGPAAEGGQQAAPGAPVSPAAQAGPPAGVSAETVYRDAYRDRLGGKYDVALQGFQNYLRWYPGTDLACNAQFYVGDIHFKKKDLEKALAAFDDVLEKFPSDCNKRNDALYQKARVLAEGNQPSAAAAVYRQLRKENPSGEWAIKAANGLKELGFSANAPSPKKKR